MVNEANGTNLKVEKKKQLINVNTNAIYAKYL